MAIGFGWIGKFFKFLINTIKTFSGDEGRDARIEGKVKHAQRDLKKHEIESEIDVQQSFKEDKKAIDNSEDILVKNSLGEKKTKQLKAEVDFFLKHEKETHIVKTSTQEFNEIINVLEYLISVWKKAQDHIEKSSSKMEKDIGSHKDANSDLDHEKKFIKQETQVLKRIIRRKEEHLHPREKSAILVRRRNIFNDVVAFNENEIKLLGESKVKLDQTNKKIRSHLEKANKIKEDAHFKSWKHFSTFLGKLDFFFQNDDQKLAINTRLLLRSEANRMRVFAASVKEINHKLGALSVLQREYDSLLIQEQEEIQKGEPALAA